MPSCLSSADLTRTCPVAMVDLNGDGKPELVLADRDRLFVYRHDTSWRQIRLPDGSSMDTERQAAFGKSEIKTAKPLWNDLEIGGVRFKVSDPDGDTDVDD